MSDTRSHTIPNMGGSDRATITISIELPKRNNECGEITLDTSCFSVDALQGLSAKVSFAFAGPQTLKDLAVFFLSTAIEIEKLPEG